MYLKEIIVNGFKSFADKLVISLDGKTTCIVGPNGSGKSNVVDAVRWVLGEQSVKSLRGEGSMTDVIFSGSKNRKPLNVASVELIFDNSKHELNVPYTEISVKRKVYRSGENEYYLNNDKCRLKDITNLFMDTGMGKESFNIISQGEVDKILSNSSLDRRVIFEEASGILKYKKRKEEALRKLDRTHNNIDRVNDIITELEMQVGPLKRQSKKAKEYLENKQGLDQYEVALLAYDIENIHNQLELEEKRREQLEEEIFQITSTSSKMDAKLEEDQRTLLKLENEKTDCHRELISVTEEKEKLDAEKNLLKERSKSSKEEEQIKEEIRLILEEKEKLNGSILVLSEEEKQLEKLFQQKNTEVLDKERELQNQGLQKNVFSQEYSSKDQEMISLAHQKNRIQMEIDQNGDLPNSVRKVLENRELSGIYDTIGNVLNVEEKYVKALNIAIASCKNFIIVKDENSAKKAIEYLKEEHLGRATFFPLNVIESRAVDEKSMDTLQKDSHFLGVLSNLVEYDKKYQNIIENQLGNVLVVEDMDSAISIGKIIRNRYKIVTLEGDVIHTGGSMSGGSTSHAKSSILLKQELRHIEEKRNQLQKEKEEIGKSLVSLQQEIQKTEENLFQLSKEKVEIEEALIIKRNEKKEKEEKYQFMTKEYESLESVQNHSISQKEEELIQKYHEKSSYKEQLELRIGNIEREIVSLKDKIERSTADDKLKNQNLRQLEKEYQELEIRKNRSDVQLDHMLEILSSEYEMTYEKAKSEYVLDIEPDEAREKVNLYRANIKRIGMVNLEAIEEYEKVSTRYDFLIHQREDLIGAENTLLEIMNEMDQIMIEDFKITFDKIKVEFQKVFKELFNGGSADLKLTDPENLLTTGVDIVASPPGKKLTTISLLSGGEKTLTAISLLFAILNVKTVPFCLFDEVEAALDEVNVEGFGNYLNHYKDKTQFLIITHKKKTMEYANTLYGITMQESGVSKLVSVKLEKRKETV